MLNNSVIITPEDAIKLLIDGNRRFVEGNPIHPHSDAGQRHEVIDGQSPFATVLTCSDSRVPPEVIFDCGIGDLFVIRVAGNIAGSAVMGSIVYAIVHLYCPLVTVLGHEFCGAVTASIGTDESVIHEPPAIIMLIESVRKNIPKALSMKGNTEAKIAAAISENTAAVVKQITEEPAIASRIAEGKTTVRNTYYSLTTGEVKWN